MSAKFEMLNKIEDLIFLEADLLDRKQWQNWLDLYTSDCVIWVPSWDSEEQLVEDPELSVNMMYLVGKPALEARVHRITSVDAYASLPLSRTMHSVTNIRLLEETSTILKVVSKMDSFVPRSEAGKNLAWRMVRLFIRKMPKRTANTSKKNHPYGRCYRWHDRYLSALSARDVKTN